MLQPDEADRLGWQFYDCTRITTPQSSQYSFANFDIVCVINCSAPDAAFWTSVQRFAESGGGVFVVAGANGIQPEKWSIWQVG